MPVSGPGSRRSSRWRWLSSWSRPDDSTSRVFNCRSSSRPAEGCGCRPHRPAWSCGMFVFVQDAAEPIAPADGGIRDLRSDQRSVRGALVTALSSRCPCEAGAGCSAARTGVTRAADGRGPDRGAAEQFVAAASDPALHDCAFMRGIRTPVSTTAMPVSARIVSNMVGYLPSRSQIRNRPGCRCRGGP